MMHQKHTKKSFWIPALCLGASLVALPALAQQEEASSEESRQWSRISERLDANQDGQITQEEYEAGSQRFERGDRNGDGVWTAEDFPGRGRRGGAGPLAAADADKSGEVTLDEWSAFVSELDADGDGVLSREEMGATGSSRGQRGKRGLDSDGDGSVQVSEMQAHFAKLDRDSDGVVSADERPRRRKGQRARRAGATRLLNQADADGDRELTLGEWQSFLNGLDGDGDAVLRSDELATLRPEGAPEPRREREIEIARLEELFARFDADDNGVISEEEWPRRSRRGNRGRGFRG
ncbi:MAG: hypothetical protein AAF725_02370 [Acidobacteriota bacterium]